MNSKYLLPILLLFSSVVFADNRTEQSPITMEQLMDELRIQGGNFKFTFDRPVFARVTTEVANPTKSDKKEIEHFATASAHTQIELYFSASEMFVGDYPTPQKQNDRKMLIKLSDCKATSGTRIIHYQHKFSGSDHAMYSPDIPLVPEIGKQYILHWYYKQGDPYYAKAVIEFSETEFKP